MFISTSLYYTFLMRNWPESWNSKQRGTQAAVVILWGKILSWLKRCVIIWGLNCSSVGEVLS